MARATAVHHPDSVAGLILAAASGKTVDPQINSAPMRAGDLTLPEAIRMAALRLAFFAPGHDPTPWLVGWYPETLAMQVDCVQRTDVARYWGAGNAPVFEIIAACDPFHQRDEWGDLRARYGDRVTTTVIDDASHALFPEQPDAVAAAVVDYLRTVEYVARRGEQPRNSPSPTTPPRTAPGETPGRENDSTDEGLTASYALRWDAVACCGQHCLSDTPLQPYRSVDEHQEVNANGEAKPLQRGRGGSASR